MKMIYKQYIKAAVFFTLCFGLGTGFAQVHISSQPHTAAITSAVSDGRQTGFSALYTAAEDGFIIKWTDTEQGEHFQISDKIFSSLPCTRTEKT